MFFQQSNRPSGNIAEEKVYYSRKHKLYGLKTEMFVLSNGMVLGISNHYPASMADVDMFYENVEFYKISLGRENARKNHPEYRRAC